MKKFSEFITEGRYPGLDKNMKADKVISDDKDWDKIFILNKDTYDKAEEQIVALVAHDNIWKTDYNPKEYTIKIRFDK